MTREKERSKKIAEVQRRFSRTGQLWLRCRRLVRGFAWGLLSLLAESKRAVDFLVAAFLLLLLSPLFGLLRMMCHDSTRLLARTPRLGLWGKVFQEYEFTSSGFPGGEQLHRGMRRLPVLLNVLAGDMAFVGPRAVSPGDLTTRDAQARRRYDVRPGLICLWWLRQRANMPFAGEARADHDYVEGRSLGGDLAIVLRALPSVLIGHCTEVAKDRVNILDIEINNQTMGEALAEINKLLKRERPAQVCFVNADCANIACRDSDYRTLLKKAALTLSDGIGMRLAGKLLGQPVRENVNGTDLFPRICEKLSGTGEGIYLLGGQPGIAVKVADWVSENYPELQVSGTQHGYFTAEEEPEIVARIAASGAAILLVAFGAPEQDKWIAEHLQDTGVKVAMGVGGLFDFYSGNIPRAPQWMREISAEWLYRFWQEPGRMWKRYFLGNGIFLGRVMRQKWTKNSTKTRLPGS
jgi:N-acetylglucosaminyldiphosphoundecaprenol N-acetyl-beta-D-mannosaminyltransferase